MMLNKLNHIQLLINEIWGCEWLILVFHMYKFSWTLLWAMGKALNLTRHHKVAFIEGSDNRRPCQERPLIIIVRNQFAK